MTVSLNQPWRWRHLGPFRAGRGVRGERGVISAVSGGPARPCLAATRRPHVCPADVQPTKGRMTSQRRRATGDGRRRRRAVRGRLRSAEMSQTGQYGARSAEDQAVAPRRAPVSSRPLQAHPPPLAPVPAGRQSAPLRGGGGGGGDGQVWGVGGCWPCFCRVKKVTLR